MIERFTWTDHALMRLAQRNLDRGLVEGLIREQHANRFPNPGSADWTLVGVTSYGEAFQVVYDHPDGVDTASVRIVSAWRIG